MDSLEEIPVQIKYIMSRPDLIRSGVTVGEAVCQMNRSNSGYLLVVDEEHRPVGIFGPENILKYAEGYCSPEDGVEKLAEGFQTVHPDEILSEIKLTGASYLLALEEGLRPVGVVALSPPVANLERYVNRLKSMLDAAYNGIIEVDAQGLIVTVN